MSSSLPSAASTTAAQSTAVAASRDAPAPERRPLPALTLLAHPDLDRIGDRAVLGELACGRVVELSRLAPRFLSPHSGAGEPLRDRYLSRSPWTLEAVADDGDSDHGGAGIRLSRRGSPMELRLDGRPVESEAIVPPADLARGVVLELARRVALVLKIQEPPPERWPRSYGLVGESAPMLRVRQGIERLQGLESTVLVTGATGTGKELVARAVHRVSRRKNGPLVAVNLGALTPTLAAAELFGAKKGAYTGATADRPGLFVQADGGTLFLDEIGEASPEVQAMLLRTLETGEVLPVGGGTPRRVDVMVVAATDADLERRAAAGDGDGHGHGHRHGDFKAPLLHRLTGYRLHLPRLAERREDIGPLLVHFLRRVWDETGLAPPAGEGSTPPLPTDLAGRLARYDFPGNVRELAHLARQLVLESRGEAVLRPGPEMDRRLSGSRGARGDEPVRFTPDAPAPPRRRKPSEIPEDEIEEALAAHRWEIGAAARELGIPRTSLSSVVARSERLRASSQVDDDTVRRAVERHGADVAALVEALQLSEPTVRRLLKRLGPRES
jgi:two-component system nitrogen regulation response regulator GlnG